MSTDLHDRPRQPSPDDGRTPPDKPKSSLSIAQIVGGALAAMTAAALGSRLSLAGTVLGAAFASVIAALAGALYTASLRRTTRGVSTVIARVRPGTAGSPAAPPAATPPTTTLPTTATDGWATGDLAARPGELGAATAADTPDAAPRRLRIGWKQVVLGALLMFVVAALVLTGIELATGRALSGGNGTTVSQVADPATRPTPAPTRSASPSASPTRSATPSASAAPSATPSAVPSNAPSSAAPSPSASAAPSSTPTAAPSATPSPSASGPAVSAPAATPGS